MARRTRVIWQKDDTMISDSIPSNDDTGSNCGIVALRTRSRAGIVAFVVMLSIWSTACYADRVYIGAALPLSGKNSDEGAAMQCALEQCVDTVNRQGGIDGSQLALVIRDDRNDAKVARQIAEEFAGDERIIAVIGHQFSSVALGAVDVYDQAGLVLISPSASNPKVTQGREWVYSMNYRDDMQGQSVAGYLAVVMKAKRVVLIHCDDAYGTGLRESFSRKASQIGLKVTQAFTYSEKTGVGDDFIGSHLGESGKPDADAVVLFTHAADGAELVVQLRNAGFNGPIIGPDAFAKKGFVDALGNNTTAVLVASPFLFELSSLEANIFVDEYRARYSAEPTVWGAFCYDSAALIADAVRGRGTSRKAVRQFLAGLHSPESGRRGITGKLFFDSHGNIQRPIVFSMIEGGHFKPAFTQLRPATEPHVLKNLDSRVNGGNLVVIGETPYYLNRVVYVGLDFYRINNVDIAHQNFEVEFFLWYRWMGDIDVGQIKFLNGVYKEENQIELLREDQSGPVKYACYKVKGTYLTPYDLRMFPFDTQHMPIRLSHQSKDANHIMLVVDAENLSDTDLKAIYPEEWIYVGREDYSGTHTEHSTFGDPDYIGSSSDVEFSIYETRIIIKRILFPFLVKLFLPLLIMLVVSVLVLLIPRDQFDARIGLAMTALLSLLVFHLAQSASLPSVGYLIKADQYFMASYVMMFALILNTITVNLFMQRNKQALARRIDRCFALIVIPSTIAILAHLTYTGLA